MDFAPSLGFVLGVLAVAILIYFAPSIVAILRRHSSRKAIFLINFVAGWTLAGWFVAMFWAWTDFGLGRWVQRRRRAAFKREADEREAGEPPVEADHS